MVKRMNKALETSFEEAVQELEAIVRLMEEGNLTLDEALAKFEQGIKLSRLCSEKLAEAEQKIDFLLNSEDGEFILKPAGLTGDRNE